MNKTQRYSCVAFSAVFALAVFCFFCFRYRFHVAYQEQYQLFEWTAGYFASVCQVPGGFSDWCGRFLVQFFIQASAGAVIYATLLTMVQVLCFLTCRERNLLLYSLTFIPAVLLLIFCCNESSLPGALVAVILSLTALVCAFRFNWNPIIRLALIPVLYMACGPVAAVYALAICADRMRPAILALSVVILAVCPFAGQFVFHRTLLQLSTGVHYFRYPFVVTWMPLAVSLVAAVICWLSALKWDGVRPSTKAWTGWCVAMVIAAAAPFIVRNFCDFRKEESMKYDFLVRYRLWNRTIDAAAKKQPNSPMTVSCLNLALAMNSQLADHQFEFFQNGPDGLLPGFVRDFTSPLPTSEAYWNLGMVNTAQRYTFEAQEAIPDQQKSARCYKRLVQTNIINGDIDVARKYLDALDNTLFYRRWALDMEKALDAGKALDDPELKHVSELRLREHDFLFSETEMDSMIGLLMVENGTNTVAIQYLMSWCLLKKDLDRFEQCFSLVRGGVMNRSYQEALLLHWVMTHTDFEGLPFDLQGQNVSRLGRFVEAYQSGTSEEEMLREFGDTYWFYYFYRYK